MDAGPGAGFACLDSAAFDHHHGQRNRRLGWLVRCVQSPGPESLGLLTLLLDEFVADLSGEALKMPG